MVGSDDDRDDLKDGRSGDPEPDETVDGASTSETHLLNRPGIRVLVHVMVIAVVILALVRIFVFEPFRIPTGSMRPTILEGDVLLVNKLPYTIRSLRTIPFTGIPLPYIEIPGLGHLDRGDVVVFDLPKAYDPGTIGTEHYVKRCVAIKGDTVQMLEGRISVNGREVPRARGDSGVEGQRAPIPEAREFELFRHYGRIIIPYKGFEVQLDSVSAARWRPLIEGEGISVGYRNRIVFLGGLPATRYTFRHDYFLALGDNSSDSFDSRFFGFVPYDNLIGQALLIYWSREPEGHIRWNRIVTFVH